MAAEETAKCNMCHFDYNEQELINSLKSHLGPNMRPLDCSQLRFHLCGACRLKNHPLCTNCNSNCVHAPRCYHAYYFYDRVYDSTRYCSDCCQKNQNTPVESSL